MLIYQEHEHCDDHVLHCSSKRKMHHLLHCQTGLMIPLSLHTQNFGVGGSESDEATKIGKVNPKDDASSSSSSLLVEEKEKDGTVSEKVGVTVTGSGSEEAAETGKLAISMPDASSSSSLLIKEKEKDGTVSEKDAVGGSEEAAETKLLSSNIGFAVEVVGGGIFCWEAESCRIISEDQNLSTNKS
ncbi:uncharacterized protein [Euphorbia lathyris]|uniref:uncharacterized protein isoform X2 n=1 Tax=Euphorbia lathyris TaxID=212925 RepID=UPI0033144BA6